MSILSFIQGIGIGLMVSAPLGPIGILVIQRTLNKGKISGFFTGLGAAAADIFYAFIAGFGIAFITKLLTEYQDQIRIVGGLVLLIFAYTTFTANVTKQIRKRKAGKQNYYADFFSTFFLTISNPVPFVVFGIAFATLSMAQLNWSSVLVILGGVVSGAILWWFGLVSFVNMFRAKFKLKQLWWVNKITGIIVAAFAVFIFITVFFNLEF